MLMCLCSNHFLDNHADSYVDILQDYHFHSQYYFGFLNWSVLQIIDSNFHCCYNGCCLTISLNSFFFSLTISCTTLKNCQTYLENLDIPRFLKYFFVIFQSNALRDYFYLRSILTRNLLAKRYAETSLSVELSYSSDLLSSPITDNASKTLLHQSLRPVFFQVL